jgi:hypothetical protein
MIRSAAWFLALAASAAAATLEVELPGSATKTIDFPVAVDDDHLAEPPGYFPPSAPAACVLRRIVVENVGDGPIPNPDLRINGRPLFPAADARDLLGLAPDSDLLALFAAWRDRVIHATTELDTARDPVVLLGALGAAYCGDDARALGAITAARGGEVRFARLNGHSAAEHKVGESWVLLDGDQNLVYLGWDNRTPVGEAAILADPLLALRTQVYGRHSTWREDAAWQNTARFEFVDTAREQKKLRLKGEPPQRDWQLPAGAKVAFDLAATPPLALAKTDALEKSPALRAAACTVEFSARQDSLPFPVVADGMPIRCQAARTHVPLLRSGKNSVEFRGDGRLRVTFEYEESDRKPVPTPLVAVRAGRFEIAAESADRMWWQASADSDFRVVAPNLDRVEDFRPAFALAALDDTFLPPGKNFFRAKVRRDGVWSDWSSPVEFDMRKPAQPEIVSMEGADGDQMRIRWKPASGEMLVFGSNRLDFLPEIFGDREITRTENGAARASVPNRNLLATVPAGQGEAFVPVRACYRLVLREDGALSVPSALVRAQRVPADVLQNRHVKAEGDLVGRDLAEVERLRAP